MRSFIGNFFDKINKFRIILLKKKLYLFNHIVYMQRDTLTPQTQETDKQDNLNIKTVRDMSNILLGGMEEIDNKYPTAEGRMYHRHISLIIEMLSPENIETIKLMLTIQIELIVAMNAENSATKLIMGIYSNHMKLIVGTLTKGGLN